MYCDKHGYRADAEFENVEVLSSDGQDSTREWLHRGTHTVDGVPVELRDGVYRSLAHEPEPDRPKVNVFDLTAPEAFSPGADRDRGDGAAQTGY